MHFRPRQAPCDIRSRGLRRPELVVRHTSYQGVVVDERLLTRAFGMPVRTDRLQAVLLVRGRLTYGGPAPLGVGQVLLLHPHQQNRFRCDDAEWLEIEWPSERSLPAPRVAGNAVDPGTLAHAFDRAETEQRETFDAFVATFRRAGLDVPVLGPTDDGPSERDVRLAQALGAQLSTLTDASSLGLGEIAGLSPRQLQRVYAEFCDKYGFPMSSWRDTRNRWRVQVAAVLTSVRVLTLAQIAEEVGYNSVPAMGRAFAKVGFPSPAELRRHLIG